MITFVRMTYFENQSANFTLQPQSPARRAPVIAGTQGRGARLERRAQTFESAMRRLQHPILVGKPIKTPDRQAGDDGYDSEDEEAGGRSVWRGGERA
jgi:hypothetical protein